jgi:hypothetical protein
MKLIFLDVDGVLNHSNAIGWKRTDESLDWRVIDPDCVFEINRILRETGAKIVLSSVWRLSEEGTELITECIMEGSIIGKTPWIQKKMDMFVDRKEEIKKWLSDNQMNIKAIAVIDDDIDADLGDGTFFKTDFENGGLTKEIADNIIKHLNEM